MILDSLAPTGGHIWRRLMVEGNEIFGEGKGSLNLYTTICHNRRQLVVVVVVVILGVDDVCHVVVVLASFIRNWRKGIIADRPPDNRFLAG